MLRAMAALLIVAAASAHGGHHNQKEKDNTEWRMRNNKDEKGPNHRMGGWHDRMFAVKDALSAAGKELSWEPSAEIGRSVMFAPASDGTTSVHVYCVASSVSLAKESDMVVLTTRASENAANTVSMYKCADDAAYLTTGHAELKIDSAIDIATTGAYAMLLAEDAAVTNAANHQEGKSTLSMVSSARYAAAAAAPSAAVDTQVVAASSLRGGVNAERALSSEPASSTANGTTGATGEFCGREGLPACETEEEKKTDAKVQEGEANFALMVAFIGCIAIVRASNKYSRDPS